MKHQITCNRGTVELSADRIDCRDIVLPGEYHPHNMRLWVIGNEFGAVCAVWADCEQDALDEMVDRDWAQSFLVDDPDNETTWTSDEREEWTSLGNAGEPCDLSSCWMGEVQWDKQRDYDLIIALAEARGANADTLDR